MQRWLRHPARATRDAMVEARGAVFEAKFLMPWSFPEEGAAQKYMPQLQHNVGHQLVTSVFSVITGGGKWVEIVVPANSNTYCLRPRRVRARVERGDPKRLFGIDPPPRSEAVRAVDMSSSNGWPEFAAQSRNSRCTNTLAKRHNVSQRTRFSASALIADFRFVPSNRSHRRYGRPEYVVALTEINLDQKAM